MDEGIYIAAAGGMKQQQKMDIISNNLANVNNVGFKKDQAIFESMMTPFKNDLSFEASRNALLSPALSNDSVSYVGVSGFSTNHSQGSLYQTGNPLNVGLDGSGYFAVQTDAGVRYTRKGEFKLDKNSLLVTQSGRPVLDTNGQPVRIDTFGQQIILDPDGTVSTSNGKDSTAIAKLKVVDFNDKSQLIKEGDGLYRLADPKTPEQTPTATLLKQGMLESSNVNVVADMAGMMESLRIFESYQKVIQSIDQMNNASANTIGKLS